MSVFSNSLWQVSLPKALRKESSWSKGLIMDQELVKALTAKGRAYWSFFSLGSSAVRLEKLVLGVFCTLWVTSGIEGCRDIPRFAKDPQFLQWVE